MWWQLRFVQIPFIAEKCIELFEMRALELILISKAQRRTFLFFRSQLIRKMRLQFIAEAE